MKTIVRSAMELKDSDSDSAETETETEPQPRFYSKFSKSLQELRDLCTQLHAAAGHCESTFLNSNHKHLVVENTKEYVCRAVVAVVDHLGSVSTNLDDEIYQTNTKPIAQTEMKIDFLKQKLLISQQYSDKLALTKLTWKAYNHRYNFHYLKPPITDVLGRDKSLRDSKSDTLTNDLKIKHGFEVGKRVPFFYTCNYKSSSSSQFDESVHDTDEEKTCSSSLTVLPVYDKLSLQPKPGVLSLQFQDKHKIRRGTLFRKSLSSNDILSIIRRRK